jgi:hypothetical protein
LTEKTVLARKNKLASATLIGDQRGAVAFEMPFVWGFLMLSLFLPLADLAIAGFRFISAHQALRDMGQLIQYSPPTDVTNISTWQSSLPATVGGYSVSVQVYCGNPGTTPCTADAPGTISAKYYKLTTSFPLSPLVLGSLLCSTCTVTYSQPFQ